MAKTTKKAAQLDREIAAALARKPLTARKAAHELFYVSADQQGGKVAEQIERFHDLAEALDTLARLSQGSITYGNAADGPQYMIVWAAPEHTDLLYWTDGDLNAQPYVQGLTKTLRDEQAPRAARKGPHGSEQYFNDRFEKARRKHWGSSAHATKRSKRSGAPRVVHVEAATPAGYRWLRMNARGATVTPEGFAVTDEAAWAQSLAAAGAYEIK